MRKRNSSFLAKHKWTLIAAVIILLAVGVYYEKYGGKLIVSDVEVKRQNDTISASFTVKNTTITEINSLITIRGYRIHSAGNKDVAAKSKEGALVFEKKFYEYLKPETSMQFIKSFSVAERFNRTYVTAIDKDDM